MKRLLIFTITMMLTAAFGVAYANGGGAAPAPTTYDMLLPLIPAVANAASVEGSNPGGLRSMEPEKALNNDITDFTGRTYDTLSEIGPANAVTPRSKTVESSNAGGPRSGMDHAVSITTFDSL